MSEEGVVPDINEQLEQFIKSANSSQLILKDSILNGAIYNDSSKPKTKWDELIDFQSEWKTKLKSNIVLYFNDLPPRTPLGVKKNYNKNKIIFKKKFQSYSTTISPVFSSKVNLVVADTYQNLQPAIMLQQDKIKIWDFTKATQFFQRMSVKVPQLIDLEQDQIVSKLDEITYFDNDPHVYLFDILQSYKPLMLKHWDRSNTTDFTYPRLYKGSYGKCPFEKENTTLSNPATNTNKIKKRYFRDELNKKYALKLKRLYRFHAHFKELITPELNEYDLMESYHDCLDSRILFDEVEKIKLKRTNTNFKFMSFNEYDKEDNIYTDFSRLPDSDLIELSEDSEDDNNHNYKNNNNPSSEDTLDTELGSDAKLSSLGDFEARTDLKKDINATGYNDISLPSKSQYCENCHVHVTSLQQHINSNNHLNLSQDNSRYIHIDKLLEILRQ